MNAYESRADLVETCVKLDLIKAKAASSITVPQSVDSLLELFRGKLSDYELATALAHKEGFSVYDQRVEHKFELTDSSHVVKGGSKLDWFLRIESVLYVTNPYNSILITKGLATHSGISDMGILPLNVLDSDIWSAIHNVTPVEEKPIADDDPEAKAQAQIILDKIIDKGLKLKCSDIHFIPSKSQVNITMRIDGNNAPIDSYDKDIHESLSRILWDGECGVNYEKNKELDGRFSRRKAGKLISFRVASIPCKVEGEKFTKTTIRILDGDAGLVNIDQLGLSGENLGKIKKAFKAPQGMILVTGPTGSGKSTTLYSGMRFAYDHFPHKLYYTLEDPVEQEEENFIQVECNKYLPFSTALRNLLRQDPDVIMVGEIRDSESANIAVEASLTGHLVSSTLHTKGCHETIGRMRELGVQPTVLGESILACVSQRLVRKLCNHCKVKVKPSDVILSHQKYIPHLTNHIPTGADFVLYEANKDGCKKCMGGYKGRVGVVEVLEMDEEVESMLLEGVSPKEMKRRQIVNNTFVDMWQDGHRRVALGETTYEELEMKLDTFKEYDLSASPLTIKPAIQATKPKFSLQSETIS